MLIAFMLIPHGALAEIIYVGGFVACVASAFWRPRLGIYFLVPLIPLQTFRYRLHDFPLGEKFVDIVLLGVLLGLLLRRDRAMFVRSSLNRPLFFYALFLYFSLWAGSLFMGGALPLSPADPRLSDWKNYVEMPLLFALVASTIEDKKQIKILLALMCLSFLVVNRSFYNTMHSRDLSAFSYNVRDAGPLGYAGVNGLAAFEVEFAAFLLCLYAFEKKKLIKLGLIGLLVTSVYCVLFSYSRGAYVAYLVVLVFVGIFKERKLLLVVLLTFLAWETVLPASVQQRIEMTEQNGELDNSAAGRVTLWKDALNLIKRSPIIGTGFDTYKFMGRFEMLRDTHNYYLKVAVETGFVGLMLFLWILYKLFQCGFSLYRTAEDPFLRSLGLGVAALVVAAVVLNLFGDRWTFFQLDGFMWVLLGCVARGHLLEEQSAEQAEKASVPEGEFGSAVRVASPVT